MSDTAIEWGVRQAFSLTATYAQEAAANIGFEWTRPFVLLRPQIMLDGNQWCALYGANLQDGVAGFGDSPADAAEAFNKAWFAKTTPPETNDAG